MCVNCVVSHLHIKLLIHTKENVLKPKATAVQLHHMSITLRQPPVHTQANEGVRVKEDERGRGWRHVACVVQASLFH